jgi:hypothetical protein
MFSMAQCHIATGFRSRVGARPDDLRPSYAKHCRRAMRPEAGLPNMSWKRPRLAVQGCPDASCTRLKMRRRISRSWMPR